MVAGEGVEELLPGHGVRGQARVQRSGLGGREASCLVGPLVEVGGAVVAPRPVVLEVVSPCEGTADEPALRERVADALSGHGVLEEPGIADEGPAGAGGRALEAAQHRLGDDDHGGHLPGLGEQAGVERRGEPSQGGEVRLGPLLGRPAGQVRGPGDGQQVDAVLAGRGHQAQAGVDVDLAPVRGGQPLPVGEQHGHLALGLPARPAGAAVARRSSCDRRPRRPTAP